MSRNGNNRITLSEDRIPKAWYNITADVPVTFAAGAAPRHRPADRPGRPGAALSDGADRAGGEHRARTSRSRSRCARCTSCGGPRRWSARAAWKRCWTRRPTSTTSTRASARPAATSPTPPWRRPSTTSRKASSGSATETGAGQWGSALALACQLVRPGVQGLHGQGQLPAKALPPLDDADVGRDGVGQPQRRDRGGPQHPGRGSRLARQPGHRHQRGGRGGGHQRRRHQVLAGQRAQPRAAAPDGHRPGGAASRWRWPASSPTWSSAAWAAAATLPGSPSPSCAKSLSTGSEDALRGRRADRLPVADPRASMPTTLATRPS